MLFSLAFFAAASEEDGKGKKKILEEEEESANEHGQICCLHSPVLAAAGQVHFHLPCLFLHLS
jgi:hypothetical protein